MVELKGKYNTAKIFTDNIEDEAVNQINNVLNHPAFEGSVIRIMPDVHAGAGCVIGFTQKNIENIVPNLVGVDGSCGVLAVELDTKDIDFKKLDKVVHENVPSGFSIHSELPFPVIEAVMNIFYPEINQKEYKKAMEALANEVGVETDRLWKSVGTLGGGNHFIAINKDSNDTNWLVIHSGSRHMGLKVAEYWQNKAIANLEDYLAKARQVDDVVKNKSLAWLSGKEADRYLQDMELIHIYAILNRLSMAANILLKMDWTTSRNITTVHNYIDGDVIRKGAIRAEEGEQVVIPLNMKDGVIFGVGKGNEDWNCSAPHGAGRKMSRGDARRSLSMEDFKQSMSGVYSSTITKDTIDEAPMAYKDASEILANVSDTIEIVSVAKEIYNFKAAK